MVTGRDDEERLHLGTASPWRVVLAEMASREAGPGIRSTGDLPADARPGGMVVHLVGTARLAIIQWDWIEESGTGAGDIGFESIRFSLVVCLWPRWSTGSASYCRRRRPRSMPP